MSVALHYFRWAFLVTAAGLVGAFWLGWAREATLGGALSFLLVGALLAVLEISLSFDNAIVNANKLHRMTPRWQRRFLTWGILIAVFGMRVVFPLAVVAIAAWVSPWEAVRLAVAEPGEYARLMRESHTAIAAFGGAFLMMVALDYFIDDAKEVDWLHRVEDRLRRCSCVRGLGYWVVAAVVAFVARFLPGHEVPTFLFAAAIGLAVFSAVHLLSRVLDARAEARSAAATGGFGAFLYLEVLDASFSFDGVIGAFALTQNLFLIAIGLGIGAMYVRSMTIMLVDRHTLVRFRFLEHGAFYSILMLSLIMFVQSLVHVPETVTGLLGAFIIGLSLVSSIRFNRRKVGSVSELRFAEGEDE
jgi:uncharacterized protein